MKKFFYLALIITAMCGAALIFTACGGDSGSGGSDDKLICGVTVYDPMNYKDENGEWTGFDTEFAKMVGEKLGMEVEFQEIKWENKYSELAAGTINCIWNGFTANASESDGKKRSEYVDFSYSYMLNQQCIVVKTENMGSFATFEDLAGKTASAEKGSAGESVALEAIGESGTMVDASAQISTFTEVKSGAVDFAVVDILLAQQMAGSGNYDDLSIADITLDSEVYAIGFKKGSSLTEKVNKAIKELFDEGKLHTLAEKYNLTNNLQLDAGFKG